jgi:hypothetical protein
MRRGSVDCAAQKGPGAAIGCDEKLTDRRASRKGGRKTIAIRLKNR